MNGWASTCLLLCSQQQRARVTWMVCLLGMRAARKAWQASNHKTTPRLSFCRSGSLHDAKKQVSREKQKLISKRGRFVPAASEEEEEENGEEGELFTTCFVSFTTQTTQHKNNNTNQDGCRGGKAAGRCTTRVEKAGGSACVESQQAADRSRQLEARSCRGPVPVSHQAPATGVGHKTTAEPPHAAQD